MAEEKFKRNIAFKLRIGDLLRGNPIIEAERFSFLDLDNKKVARINLAGSIVDKYESEERNYIFLTIDDGTGQIKIKAFGDDSEKLKDVEQGQTIILIGFLRYFNNELYITPEIVRELDPRYLLVRKLEVERFNPVAVQNQTQIQSSNQSQEQVQNTIKDKIIEQIKIHEPNGGIETEKLSANLNETPEIVTQEIQKLIGEGLVFEPRPGIVRWLG
jgi:RPA family protein